MAQSFVERFPGPGFCGGCGKMLASPNRGEFRYGEDLAGERCPYCRVLLGPARKLGDERTRFFHWEPLLSAIAPGHRSRPSELVKRA